MISKQKYKSFLLINSLLAYTLLMPTQIILTKLPLK